MRISWIPIALGLMLETAHAGTALTCSASDRSSARADEVAEASLEDVMRCAAERDVIAINELGRRHGTGKGAPLDARKSFELYREAALAGYVQAKANLGFMYFQGEGVERDYAEAYKWSEQAAQEGSAQAQYLVGYVHATGTGGEKNGKLAEKWWLAAAEQGQVKAQRSLIRLYADGELLPRNERQSALWASRARDATLLGQVWRKDGK